MPSERLVEEGRTATTPLGEGRESDEAQQQLEIFSGPFADGALQAPGAGLDGLLGEGIKAGIRRGNESFLENGNGLVELGGRLMGWLRLPSKSCCSCPLRVAFSWRLNVFHAAWVRASSPNVLLQLPHARSGLNQHRHQVGIATQVQIPRYEVKWRGWAGDRRATRGPCTSEACG